MRMHTLISTTILLFLFINCKSNNMVVLEYQNDQLLGNLGVGLVQQQNTEQQTVLYKDKEFLTKLSTETINVIPIFYKPDYGITYYVCLENDDNYYKILLNTSDTAFIKKTPEYTFYDWSNFVKKSTWIESKDLKKYPLRQSINGKEIKLKNIDDSEIEVVEVKDDWLKVTDFTLNLTYWLQWRDSNQLLVYISLLQ